MIYFSGLVFGSSLDSSACNVSRTTLAQRTGFLLPVTAASTCTVCKSSVLRPCLTRVQRSIQIFQISSCSSWILMNIINVLIPCAQLYFICICLVSFLRVSSSTPKFDGRNACKKPKSLPIALGSIPIQFFTTLDRGPHCAKQY